MRFLMGAACAAALFLAAVGGWSWYARSSSGEEREKARTYLLNRAEASYSDEEKINVYCQQTLQHIAGGGTDNAFINQDGKNCRLLGYE